jgi:hypothetical protein
VPPDAPDPLDRPAEALAAALMAWCGERYGRDGAWLPAGLWSEWAPWQRDLARRLAAAAVREAEAAAAARQREADAAVCRAKADEFRELLVDEAVQAASECAAEILAGGGGGANER